MLVKILHNYNYLSHYNKKVHCGKTFFLKSTKTTQQINLQLIRQTRIVNRSKTIVKN